MEHDEVNTAAPISLQPGVIENIEGVNDDTRRLIGPAVAAFQAAVDGLSALRDVRDAAANNAALTDSARILQTADFADRKVAEISKKMDFAFQTLRGQIAQTEAELQKPLESSVHSNTAAELRALVRSMEPAERRKLVMDSIASNDMTVLGSVLGAHTLLSGLTPLEREQYTRKFREKAQPELAQRLAVMQKAFDLVGNRSGLVLTSAEKLIGCDRATLNKLRAADAKFNRALAR